MLVQLQAPPLHWTALASLSYLWYKYFSSPPEISWPQFYTLQKGMILGGGARILRLRERQRYIYFFLIACWKLLWNLRKCIPSRFLVPIDLSSVTVRRQSPIKNKSKFQLIVEYAYYIVTIIPQSISYCYLFTQKDKVNSIDISVGERNFPLIVWSFIFKESQIN